MKSTGKIIGIGGIGTGVLFLSDTDKELGRSESRLAFLSDARDYCKLHIVFHYISVLTGRNDFVYPIGYVGNDLYGERLLEDMRNAGMNTTYISVSSTAPTMFSVCLQYPDKEGCNITSSNSACSLISPVYIENSVNALGLDDNFVVAALPEVDLESRRHLLRLGRKAGAFCVMSIPSDEAEGCVDMLSDCDLLAVNIEEAVSLIKAMKQHVPDGNPENIAEVLYRCAGQYNKSIMLLITCGNKGAVSVHNGNIEKTPPFPAAVVNTAGAGDAYLGGVLAALSMNYPFQKGRDDDYFGQSPLYCAMELGTICAGMAIEVKDSIAWHVNWESISIKIKKEGWRLKLS